jgi:hypothetical protein
MNKLSRKLSIIGAGVLLPVSMGFAQIPQQTPQSSTTTQPGPKIAPSQAAKQKAQNPQPSASAQSKPATTTVGKGKATLNNSSRSSAEYIDWVEEVDIDGNGNTTTADVAWDTKKKILYMSKDQTFKCNNGANGDGDVLMAIYGQGNTLHKPVGSGWFVADLDQDECAVPAAGLYGCRFDANGKPTECGIALVQEEDIVIRPVPKGRGGDLR